MVKVQVGEAAQLLGISRDTVRRRAERGELVAERVDDGKKGYWLIDIEASDGSDATGESVHRDAPVDADQQQVAAAEGYTGDSSVSVGEAVLRERLHGLERLVDELLDQKAELLQQVQDGQAAQRELRTLLLQRDGVLGLGDGLGERQPWWKRLFGG